MERKSILFSANVKFIEKINDEFLKCKVYVCALGKNRNFLNIFKEAAEEAEYSLFNIPVVGHMYEDENGNLHMGGHDVKVTKNEKGKHIFKQLTVPYGVVPIQDNVHYEDVQEPNGDTKTYITADCILWVGRYPELAEAAYSEDWLFSQSMEINVSDYEPLAEDKKYTNILHYTYSALCLLGKSDNPDFNVQPCFPESKVSVEYELGGNEKFGKLMDELKGSLSKIFSGKDAGKEKEAHMTDEIRDSILSEFGVSLEELDFEISDDMTEEEFKEKVSDYACKKKAKCEDENGEPSPKTDENQGNDKGNENEKFTYREKAHALESAMPIADNISYWICDFDDKYAYVERCQYNPDNCTCEDTHGRFEYAYDEANKEATLIGEFEEMIVRWLTKAEDDAINAMRSEYENLLAYKADRETADQHNALDEAIAPFADLEGNEAYDAIYANRYSYNSVEELQNACYIIRGKFSLIPKTHKSTEPSVPVGTPRTALTPREALHNKYSRT